MSAGQIESVGFADLFYTRFLFLIIVFSFLPSFLSRSFSTDGIRAFTGALGIRYPPSLLFSFPVGFPLSRQVAVGIIGAEAVGLWLADLDLNSSF